MIETGLAWGADKGKLASDLKEKLKDNPKKYEELAKKYGLIEQTKQQPQQAPQVDEDEVYNKNFIDARKKAIAEGFEINNIGHAKANSPEQAKRLKEIEKEYKLREGHLSDFRR
jgi:carbonic anhydrase